MGVRENPSPGRLEALVTVASPKTLSARTEVPLRLQSRGSRVGGRSGCRREHREGDVCSASGMTREAPGGPIVVYGAGGWVGRCGRQVDAVVNIAEDAKSVL